MRYTEYFLEDNGFRFIDRVRSGEAPWSAISAIRSTIETYLGDKSECGLDAVEKHCNLENIESPDGGVEFILSVHRSFTAPENIHLKASAIFIGKGTMLEAGAMIKAHCVIGERCQIRQGAYIRGDAIVGDNCVVGHVTEVKNAIFMDNACAGHFSYVGDSILGNNVNLGAGTKLANLQFRTRKEIDSGTINEIVIQDGNEQVKTGMMKLGSVIGDYCEIGCNSVTSPGALIAAHCWVYPNTTLPKGLYKQSRLIKNRGCASVEVSARPR